uniref:Uncharacterized protein n=1 Tax=Fagus sylvatica TaxID=28930 RepID=A0A2N9GAW3_FAGSY
MSSMQLFYVLPFFLLIVILNPIHAVDYLVINNATATLGDARIEVIGVLYHETTRVWQWSGNNEAPIGLITGIADYVRLKAGWASPHWVQRGSGLRWNEGFAVTAYFLDYCNALNDGFVAEVNALMKYYYSDSFFVKLMGKSVDELWIDYKAHYE